MKTTNEVNFHTYNDNGSLDGGTRGNVSLNYSYNVDYVYVGTMNSGTSRTLSGTRATGTATASGSNPLTMSIGSNANMYVGMDEMGYSSGSYISEIIYYQRVLTQAEIYQVQGYLAWKYSVQSGLPVASPYLTGAPTNTTGSGGTPGNMSQSLTLYKYGNGSLKSSTGASLSMPNFTLSNNDFQL